MIAYVGVTAATLGALIAAGISLVLRRSDARLGELTAEFARLSMQREYAEKQIFDLMSRLQDSEERFTELNRLVLEGGVGRAADSINATSNPTFLSNSRFLKDLGIDLSAISLERRKAFYLSSFSSMFHGALSAVRDTCLEKGFNLSRSDETHVRGNLLKFIVEEIIRSNLIIANVTGRNANVFYELAIAQLLEKRVIIIAESREDIAFDIAHQQVVLYQTPSDLRVKLRKAIESSFFDA